MARGVVAAAVFFLCASGAFAQPTQRADARHEQVRVSVGLNMFVDGPTDSSQAAMQSQEDARRKFYEIARRECAILLDVIASDCRLMTLNVTVNRHRYPQQPEGFMVNGNMMLQITTK